MIYLLKNRQGTCGKMEKRIGKTEDDTYGRCGIQERGWHLVSECPKNEEARKAYIDGATTWEDKEQITDRGWKVEAFFGKAISSKGWG